MQLKITRRSWIPRPSSRRNDVSLRSLIRSKSLNRCKRSRREVELWDKREGRTLRDNKINPLRFSRGHNLLDVSIHCRSRRWFARRCTRCFWPLNCRWFDPSRWNFDLREIREDPSIRSDLIWSKFVILGQHFTMSRGTKLDFVGFRVKEWHLWFLECSTLQSRSRIRRYNIFLIEKSDKSPSS